MVLASERKQLFCRMPQRVDDTTALAGGPIGRLLSAMLKKGEGKGASRTCLQTAAVKTQ